MPRAGIIIAVVVFCLLLLVGGGLGLYYGNVACPSFGASCSPSPSPDSSSPGPAPARVPAPAPGPRAPGAYSGPSYAPAPSRTPVNCVVSNWADSGPCSVTLCGATGGMKTQTRTVTTPAANGGTACPALTQTVPCNGPTCVTCPADQELNRATNTCLLSQQQIATNLQQTYGINVPVINTSVPPPPAVQQYLQVLQAQQQQPQATTWRTIADGSRCSVGEECQSNYCDSGVCSQPPQDDG